MACGVTDHLLTCLSPPLVCSMPVLDCNGRLGLVCCLESGFCVGHCKWALVPAASDLHSVVLSFVSYRMRFPDVFVAYEEARKLQHTIEGVIGKSIDRRFSKYQRRRGEIIKHQRELRLFDEEQESFLLDERE